MIGALLALALLGAPADTLDLRKMGHSQGSQGAPVTVIEFSDFGCGYCGEFTRETYPALHREFIATGRVRWTFIPVTMGFPRGAEGARAAECAAEQGKFWEMHDLLYRRQREWRAERRPEPLLLGYARQAKLDTRRFAACYNANAVGARTRSNSRMALLMGVRATPTFLVNGRRVEGALPGAAFRQVLLQASRRR